MIKIFLILIVSINILFSYDKYRLGEKIYNDTCVSCHGKDGKAKTNMNLIVKPRDLSLTLLNEEQTYLIAKNGAKYWGAKSDFMPSFKSILNEDQLRAVSHYISKKFNPNVKLRIKQHLDKSEKEPINQEKEMEKWGKKIFHRNCQYCHGTTGKGDGVATKNPLDSIFPYDLTKTLLTKQQMFLYVKYGSQHFGTFKDDMPSWSKKYNDFKLYSVVKYVDEIIKK